MDIAGRSEYAVAATGPFRDLREWVAKACELGAVAYVRPTIDRRRATFVERAAAAGGLTPEEGVLTPEMAAHVLRGKAAREATWQRAMELWEATPEPGRIGCPAMRETSADVRTRRSAWSVTAAGRPASDRPEPFDAVDAVEMRVRRVDERG